MFFIPLLLSLSTLLSAQPPKTHEEQCQELCDFCEKVYRLETPACIKSLEVANQYEFGNDNLGAEIRRTSLLVARDIMVDFCQVFLKTFGCLPCGNNDQQNNTAPIGNRSSSNLTFSDASYEEVIDEANATSNVITQEPSNCILSGNNDQQNNTAPIGDRSSSNLTFSNESYEEVIDEANATSNVIPQDSSNCILN